MNVRQSVCAEILNEEDLEDGEIFEDEDPNNTKSANVAPQEKEKPVPAAAPVVVPSPKKITEPENKIIRKSFENEKPPKEPLVPFFSRNKRKNFEGPEEDSRWKREGKRTRRNHEFEREGALPGEEEEDMMFVRGASPSRLDEEMEKWDREGEEMERGEMARRPARTFRGRGGIGRRGERQRGRGRGRGSMRGGKRKRDDENTCLFFLQGKCQRGGDCPYSHDILPPRKMELCKFFMKDCCAKKEKCLYMHSEFPCKYFHMGLKCYANKKCKFNHGVLTDTLRGILAKHLDTAPKDILGEFPRRDGRERDRDRDSRGDPRDMRGDQRDMRGDPRDMRGDPRDMRGDPRDMRIDPRDMRGGDARDMRGGDARDMRGDTRDMRGDTRDMRGDPRDMRGDPRDMRGDLRGDLRDMRGDPRDMRVDMRDMRDTRGGDLREMRGEFMRSKIDRDRKIPSLFDIKVAIPDDVRNSDGNHTPMPSPTTRSQESTRSSDRERDHFSSDREREKDREKEREKDREHERHKHEKSERSKERKAKREKAREHKKERKERRERERERRREAKKESHGEKIDESNTSSELKSPTQPQDIILNLAEVPIPSDKPSDDQEKKVTSSEENVLFPQHLPKKQRELFLRIQQQQREADSSQASANDDDDEDKIPEENWYSSDEETPSTSLPSILHNLTQSTGVTSCTTTTTTSSAAGSNPTVLPLLNLLASAHIGINPADAKQAPPPSTTPIIPPNLDLSNLSSVFEALTNLQKMNASNNKVTSQQETVTAMSTTTVAPDLPSELPKPELAKSELLKPEPPRVRDPRLRLDGSVDIQRRSSLEGYQSDTDLRPKTLAKPQQQPSTDVDLRSLPFKPVQHSAACEIDGSLTSHPPITWQVVPITVPKTDYASLQIQPRTGVSDPRLRRMVRPVTDELGLPRDPRQRLIDDPRARQPLLPTPPLPPVMPSSPLLSGPPPTPRYDEDHRQPPQFYHMDSDMRQFPPPTPRLEDEVYTPGPSRPIDPRQRNLSVDDPRRSHFPSRPDDTDLRQQIGHRVPFVNFQ